VVQYLVLSGRLAVDGSGNGYVVATTEDQRADAIQSIRDHIGTLNRRVQGLKDARLAHECNSDDAETEQRATCDAPGCDALVPKSDWHHIEDRDGPVCKSCYGKWVINGKSFEVADA